MIAFLHQVIFMLICFICSTVFDIRAYGYFQSIFVPIRSWKVSIAAVLSIGYLSLFLSLFCALHVLISLVIIYFLVLLLFLYLFRGQMVDSIFGSGTFMFHIMNVKMFVTSIFILIYDIPSYAFFRESGLYYFSTCVIVLLLLISLEIFQRTFAQQMLQTLMKNNSQLRFVTSSMMLINVYLLILSISYNEQAYSKFVGIFLLCTSLLLFGAFYTSFWHAVKMSVLLETERKSQRLEEQLQATKEDVEELQVFAFIDTLTSINNRRFGIDELNRLLDNHVPFCLSFLDIDHLKYVNDTFGHEEGDHYILDVVRILSGACKEGDTLSRMGGDEFMLLMPNTSYDTAFKRFQEICVAVSNIPSIYQPSISYGIIEVKADNDQTASQILQHADSEMYENKRGKKTSRSDSL